MSDRYDGPIIDAHHHFWDFGMGRYPWLLATPADSPDGALRSSYLPTDYAPLAQRNGIVASVHVEAWQDNRSRLFAQATGHFLRPEAAG